MNLLANLQIFRDARGDEPFPETEQEEEKEARLFWRILQRWSQREGDQAEETGY